MAKFRQKEFSVLSNTIIGANIGAGVGTIGSMFLPNKLENRSKYVSDPKNGDYVELGKGYFLKNKYNATDGSLRKMIFVGATTLVGAALGALVGTIKKGGEFIARKSNVDNRLMQTVVENLKKSSFKEGIDFTRDPKIATRLKTKVCIVISKISGEMSLLINMVADNKLEELGKDLVKNLPNSSVVTNTANDKFNNISISTISDASANAGLITGICDRFIHSGYPVYLVEVG